MRAILIDPEKQTFTEIQLKADDYREINTVLHCDCHTIGAYLGGAFATGFDAIFVSDDSLEDRDDPRFWFQVDANRNPPSSYPIAGLGLAMGTDKDGAGCDVKISIEDLAKRIMFTQRKFRGFDVRNIPGGIAVDAKAPIIDGTNE
jgi:hypothetical protein